MVRAEMHRIEASEICFVVGRDDVLDGEWMVKRFVHRHGAHRSHTHSSHCPHRAHSTVRRRCKKARSTVALRSLIFLMVHRGHYGTEQAGFRKVTEAWLFIRLEALLPAKVAAVLEHVTAVGVQCPVASFARSVRRARNFDEAVVEGEAVPNGVLPSLLVLSVERKQVHYKLIDLA